MYNVGYKLFEPSLVVPGVLLAALFPLLSQAAGAASLDRGRLRGLLGQTLGTLALLGLGAGLLIFLVAVPLLNLFYGQQYVESAPVLQLLAFACLPMYVNYGLTHALIALDRPKLYALFTLASLVANLGANLLLIPVLGVNGAAIATVATEIALFLLCGFALVRYITTTGVRTTTGGKQPDAWARPVSGGAP